MKNILWIAMRNLLRYKRRTLLTGSLIALGVTLVIVFGGLASSFKDTMIGVITGSSLADLQVHRRGYVESIDNLPLNLFLDPAQVARATDALKGDDKVVAFSPRVRFAAMVSNYAQTTGMRLTAVDPAQEMATCPALAARLNGVANKADFVRPGEIIIPAVLFKGLGLKLGDEVVVIATNRDGAVNGVPLKIAGVVEGIMGPSGKDGYLNVADAALILRMEKPEISEIAVHVRRLRDAGGVKARLAKALGEGGEAVHEVHTWNQLTPFATIAKMIDVLILMVRFILVSIVLISVMNIMMMSVYERINEIGTIAALGTVPSKILLLFLAEGVGLGMVSALAGSVLGLGTLWLLNVTVGTLRFQSVDIPLAASMPWGDVVGALAMVAIISVLGSLQPAYRASKLEPVDALRHV
jgi:putative ABC transport system permease protein